MDEILVQESEALIVGKIDISHLVTEDDTPVDNLFSERQMRLLTETLYTSWSGPGDGRTFVAMANVGLFFHLYRPPLVPDVMLSLDVTLPPELMQKEHRSYFVWEYGKPPDVVIEIVSNKVGKELGDKLLDYALLGAAYYVVYDPDQHITPQPLRIFARQAMRYAEISDPWLAEVGLGVTLWQGVYEGYPGIWLRWCDREGGLLATGAEALAAQESKLAAEKARSEAAQQQAEAAQQQAEAAQQQAEAAQQRAEQAEQRAAALAARLAALGIDPNAE